MGLFSRKKKVVEENIESRDVLAPSLVSSPAKAPDNILPSDSGLAAVIELMRAKAEGQVTLNLTQTGNDMTYKLYQRGNEIESGEVVPGGEWFKAVAALYTEEEQGLRGTWNRALIVVNPAIGSDEAVQVSFMNTETSRSHNLHYALADAAPAGSVLPTPSLAEAEQEATAPEAEDAESAPLDFKDRLNSVSANLAAGREAEQDDTTPAEEAPALASSADETAEAQETALAPELEDAEQAVSPAALETPEALDVAEPLDISETLEAPEGPEEAEGAEAHLAISEVADQETDPFEASLAEPVVAEPASFETPEVQEENNTSLLDSFTRRTAEETASEFTPAEDADQAQAEIQAMDQEPEAPVFTGLAPQEETAPAYELTEAASEPQAEELAPETTGEAEIPAFLAEPSTDSATEPVAPAASPAFLAEDDAQDVTALETYTPVTPAEDAPVIESSEALISRDPAATLTSVEEETILVEDGETYETTGYPAYSEEETAAQLPDHLDDEEFLEVDEDSSNGTETVSTAYSNPAVLPGNLDAPMAGSSVDVAPSFAHQSVTKPSDTKKAEGNLVLSEAEVVSRFAAAYESLFGLNGTARDVSTVLIRVRTLGSYYDALTHVRRNGFWEQVRTFDLIPEDILAILQLKADSYKEGYGSPLAMNIRFTPGIPVSVAFDYADEEAFVRYPEHLPAQQYVEELRMFPRTGANIPAHMNEALASWSF